MSLYHAITIDSLTLVGNLFLAADNEARYSIQLFGAESALMRNPAVLGGGRDKTAEAAVELPVGTRGTESGIEPVAWVICGSGDNGYGKERPVHGGASANDDREAFWAGTAVAEATGDATIERLKRSPGGGSKVAFAAHVDIRRFENSRVSNYLDLVPRVYISGDTVRYGLSLGQRRAGLCESGLST